MPLICSMISIIGGGIAGLSTALALQKQNIPCKVYERSPAYKPVGAGIWLAANAMQVFNSFGIQDDIIKAGNELSSFGLMTKEINRISIPDLQIVKDSYGIATVAIHRARLQEVLLKQLDEGVVQLGYKFEALTKTKAGYSVQFTNGKTAESKFVIGADGIHSKLRMQLFPNAQKRYSGQTCWRGISTPSIPEKYARAGYELWGNQIRFGFSPISNLEVYWFAVAKRPENDIEPTEKYKANLKQLFKDFDPFVLDLIENTAASAISRNNIEDLKPINVWHKEGVLLLGDAAHATTPNMGQGGGQAIEDAYYLGQLIKHHNDITKAFADFRSVRHKKVNAIVNQSYTLGKIAHIKRGKRLRNLAFKLAPSKAVTNNMMALYKLAPLDELL